MSKFLHNTFSTQFQHFQIHNRLQNHNLSISGKKLTDKHIFQQALNDVMKPRQEAVDKLIQMCRNI